MAHVRKDQMGLTGCKPVRVYYIILYLSRSFKGLSQTQIKYVNKLHGIVKLLFYVLHTVYKV